MAGRVGSVGPGYGREIGKRIRIHRDRLGLSQDELGQACGLSGSSISKIETGNAEQGVPRLDVLQAMADTFCVPVTVLIPSLPQAKPTKALEGVDKRDALAWLVELDSELAELDDKVDELAKEVAELAKQLRQPNGQGTDLATILARAVLARGEG